jgi:hypothetical protein
MLRKTNFNKVIKKFAQYVIFGFLYSTEQFHLWTNTSKNCCEIFFEEIMILIWFLRWKLFYIKIIKEWMISLQHISGHIWDSRHTNVTFVCTPAQIRALWSAMWGPTVVYAHSNVSSVTSLLPPEPTVKGILGKYDTPSLFKYNWPKFANFWINFER